MTDVGSIEIVESMLTEQNQINQYVDSFEKFSEPIKLAVDTGEERLLLPPNLDSDKKVTIQNLLIPILERGKANAILDNREWTQPIIWPDWTLIALDSKYIVIAEIVANLLRMPSNMQQKVLQLESLLLLMGSVYLIMEQNKKKLKMKNFSKGFRGLASKKKEGTGVGLFWQRNWPDKLEET